MKPGIYRFVFFGNGKKTRQIDLFVHKFFAGFIELSWAYKDYSRLSFYSDWSQDDWSLFHQLTGDILYNSENKSCFLNQSIVLGFEFVSESSHGDEPCS